MPRRVRARGLGRARRGAARAARPVFEGGARAEAVLLRRRVRRGARQAGARARAAGARTGTRGSGARSSSRASTTTSRSGIAPPGRTTSPRSKGAQTMLPNVLQRSASDHVPVLAEEVRELLAVRPGETVVDATFGAGGHSSLLVADLEGDGKLIAIDRDPSARAYFDRFKAARRRAGALPARRVLARARPARRERRRRPTRSCSTSASRRCSSTGRSAASRTPRTRRSTCGWTPPRSSRPASSSTRRTSASSA